MHGYYGSLIESHRKPDRSTSVPIILSDLERRHVTVRGQKFLADLHNYARTVCPRMTGFGTEIGLHAVRSIFL